MCAQVIARIANPAGMRVNQLLLEGEQVLAAADVRNLAQAATAAAKLAEIDKQLGALKGNGRVERARAYVRGRSRSSSSPASRPSSQPSPAPPLRRGSFPNTNGGSS